MKRKLIIILSFFCFIVLLGFLSDFVIVKIRDMLEQKILSVLPEGSYIKNLSLKGISGVSADSIYIKDLCILPKVEVMYTPAGILRRRIKKISFDSPSFLISEKEGGVGEGGISALFYIKKIEVRNGSVEWKNHNFKINGMGEIFSTGKGNIILDAYRLWGKVDDIPFNVREIGLSISGKISSLNVRNLRLGESEFKIETDIDGRIKGNGRVYSSDLEKLLGIEGKGFLNVFFVYDTVFTYKGNSQIKSVQDFNLPEFRFAGIKDSVNIEGKNFSGFFDFGEKIYGKIKLNDFNVKEIRGKFPGSRLSGIIDFNYMGKDTLSFVSKLKGEILERSLENFDLQVIKRGETIYIDSCRGFFNGGEFDFSGMYKDRIDGNLQINKVDISPVAEFLGVKTSAILNMGLSIHEKIYGAFSLENLIYDGLKLTLVEGNLNLTQEEEEISGTVAFVSRDFRFQDRKIFELGESNLEIEEKNWEVKGVFKSKNRKLNYRFSLNSDTATISSMRFEYPDGWLYLVNSFSFSFRDILQLRDVRFLGNRGENLRINNISISSKEINGDLDVSGFRPEFLREFGIIYHPFSGKLSSCISITGSPSSPVFSFQGGGKIEVGEEELGDSVDFYIRYKNNRVFMENLEITENGKSSDFKGMIDPKENYLNIEIKLQESGAWVFYPLRKYITANSSNLSGNLQVKGDFKRPMIYGEVNLKRANLLIKDFGIEVKDLQAAASFKGEEGELKNVSALLGDGSVQAEGRIGLRDNKFQIQTTLKNTPINWQYLNATVDGNLSIRKERENIFIEGDVWLNRSTITMEFEQKKEKGGRPSNLFFNLTFDASQGNVWIRNDLANIELAGKVGMNYERGSLLLSGNLEVRQGTFYYLYKSFEVVEGKFNFNESPEINPNIDVKAITLISSRSNGNQEQDTVFLVVSGTMKTPEFDLYSKPSLSKAEIMTLLSLNLGWEDLTSVKPIGQSVTETAFNYWVRQTLNRRLKEEFGIDVLEMQRGSEHYEFVVGKYVTDKLFVKAGTDIQSYGISEIEAEYKLKKWGYLKAERDFLGKTRFLFNLQWRY